LSKKRPKKSKKNSDQNVKRTREMAIRKCLRVQNKRAREKKAEMHFTVGKRERENE
jgi:hypothetical protein